VGGGEEGLIATLLMISRLFWLVELRGLSPTFVKVGNANPDKFARVEGMVLFLICK
jgi:hypothetical protein